MTDLSQHGLRAIEDAHALAYATSSPVVAVTHAELLLLRRERPVAPEELDDALRDHVAGVARGDVPMEQVVLGGEATRAVATLAKAFAARAIVVAAPIGRRRVPLRRSLAEQLVRVASHPVLVTARTDAKLRRDVIAASAGLTEPWTAVDRATRRGAVGRTRVLACFLGEDREAAPLVERPTRLASASERTREVLLERLRSFDVSVYPDDVHVFPLAPERAIASLADRHDADLVVLACQGGAQRFVPSSVASRVVAKTRCPLLALPLGEAARATESTAEACPTIA